MLIDFKKVMNENEYFRNPFETGQIHRMYCKEIYSHLYISYEYTRV